MLPLLQMGDDVILGCDVPLAYTNPISPLKYPLHSTGRKYTGSEYFGFYLRMIDLADPACTSAPTFLAWFGEEPWWPWIKMGQRSGLWSIGVAASSPWAGLMRFQRRCVRAWWRVPRMPLRRAKTHLCLGFGAGGRMRGDLEKLDPCF